MRLSYIKSVSIKVGDIQTNVRIPEVSTLLKDSDILQLSSFLTKCEETYHRNAMSSEDAMIIETSFNVFIMIHDNHMCFHLKEGLIGTNKFAEVPLPVALGVVDVAALLSRKQMLNDDR